MALARLALKASPLLSSPHHISSRTLAWDSQSIRRFSKFAVSDKVPDGREISVSEGEGEGGGTKNSQLFSNNQRSRGLWRNIGRDFVPALYEFFPSKLGNALLQASENLNRLFKKLSPSHLMGRVKEDDECYKLRYKVPGLAKEDVKITVVDGFLIIIGEHKEEEEEDESDDEHWSSYGHFNTNLMLPVDAKVDEIKAEMKDGMLSITIPRTEKQGRDVKEVEIH